MESLVLPMYTIFLARLIIQTNFCLAFKPHSCSKQVKHFWRVFCQQFATALDQHQKISFYKRTTSTAIINTYRYDLCFIKTQAVVNQIPKYLKLDKRSARYHFFFSHLVQPFEPTCPNSQPTDLDFQFLQNIFHVTTSPSISEGLLLDKVDLVVQLMKLLLEFILRYRRLQDVPAQIMKTLNAHPLKKPTN